MSSYLLLPCGTFNVGKQVVEVDACDVKCQARFCVGLHSVSCAILFVCLTTGVAILWAYFFGNNWKITA